MPDHMKVQALNAHVVNAACRPEEDETAPHAARNACSGEEFDWIMMWTPETHVNIRCKCSVRLPSSHKKCILLAGVKGDCVSKRLR